jgi:hypothetical protein
MKPWFNANWYGADTTHYVSLGLGLPDWSVEAYQGPVLHSKMFGRRPSRIVMMPQALLDVFYQRLGSKNPSGMSILTFEECEYRARPPGMSVEEFNLRAENYEMLLDVFDPVHQKDWHLLREYLPEIFAPGVLAQLMADPCLNGNLLGWAMARGIVVRNREHDPRWSPAWLELCNEWKTGKRPLPDSSEVK